MPPSAARNTPAGRTSSPPPPDARRSRRTALLTWARDIAIVFVIVLGVHFWRTHDMPHGLAPGFTAHGVHGESITPASVRGRPALLYFWATWCGVCRAEQGTIDSLARDHSVLTVASQSGSADDVQRFAQEHHLQFPVGVDDGGAIARRYGVTAFPTVFVLKPDGRVAFVEVGYTSRLGLLARLWLATL